MSTENNDIVINEENVVIITEENQPNVINIDEDSQSINQHETIEYINVDEPETILVSSDEAFAALGEPNPDLNHSLLNNRDAKNQHPISAITGLREELDDIEALNIVYSNERGNADFYLWSDENIFDENRVGYFVTVCDDMHRIKICDGKDIYGVVVDSAAFIGGQSEESRDYKYGLVAYTGIVMVRCELNVAVGDFVISNQYGYARKSSNNYGYKVISLKTIDGTIYALINLNVSVEKVSELAGDLKDLDERLDKAEINIASAINTSEEAYKKANEISEEALKKALEAVEKSDATIDKTQEYDKDIADANLISTQAKAIAENAIAKAESIQAQAEKNATDTLNSMNQYKSDINSAVNNIQGQVTKVSNNVKKAQEDIKLLSDEIIPLSKWTDGESSGISGFVSKTNSNSNTLAALSQWKSNNEENINSISSIKQTADANKAELDKVASYEYTNDGGIKSTGLVAITQKVDKTASNLEAVVEYDYGEYTGIAGLVAQVDANTSAIKSFTSGPGGTQIDLTNIEQRISNNEATIQSLAVSLNKYSVGDYSPAYGFLADELQDVLTKNIIYVPITTHTEGLQNFTRGYYYLWSGTEWKQSSDNSLVAFDVADVGYDNYKYWYTGNEDRTYSSKIYAAQTLYALKNGIWVAVATLGGANQAISLLNQKTNDNESSINSLVAWKGDVKETAAQILQKANDNGASIESMVTNIDKYSLGEYSQAFGLTIQESNEILKGNMVYVPTVSHTEVYDNGKVNSLPYPYTDKEVTRNGVTIFPQSDGSVQISGQLEDGKVVRFRLLYYNYPNIKRPSGIYPNINYTLSCGSNVNLDGVVVGIYMSHEDPIYVPINSSLTFTMPNTPLLLIDIEVSSFSSTEPITIYPQLEVGNIASEHKPYQSSPSTITQSFTKGYYYEWLWNDTAQRRIWTSSASPAVSFSSSYISGNDNSPFWVTGDNSIMHNGVIYEPNTLYKWNGTKWDKVIMLDGNISNRAVSAIRQNINEIELSLTSARGSYAGLDLRLDANEATMTEMVTWKDKINTNMASINLTADEVGATISSIVTNIGKDGAVNASSIVQAINDAASSVVIHADHIQIDGSTLQIDASNINLEGLVTANKKFQIDAKGSIIATGGTIGGFNITSSYIDTRVSGSNERFYIASASDGSERWIVAIDKDNNETFRVNRYGQLYATKAEIIGSITATEGKIGGFKINENFIDTRVSGSSKRFYLASANDSSGNWMCAIDKNGNTTFRVTTAGQLYASDVNISGTIKATKGKIGGCLISSDGRLIVKDVNIDGVSVSKLAAGVNENAIKFKNLVANLGVDTYFGTGNPADLRLFTYKIGSKSYTALGAKGAQYQDPYNDNIYTSDWNLTRGHLSVTFGLRNNDHPTKLTVSPWQIAKAADKQSNDISDIRMKKNISLYDDRYDVLFDNLIPCRYKYINGESDRFHTGFIAQEVVQALEDSGLTTKDFAAVCQESIGEDGIWYLRRDEFIALNTWQIQKLKARVTELENKIAELTKEK